MMETCKITHIIKINEANYQIQLFGKISEGKTLDQADVMETVKVKIIMKLLLHASFPSSREATQSTCWSSACSKVIKGFFFFFMEEEGGCVARKDSDVQSLYCSYQGPELGSPHVGSSQPTTCNQIQGFPMLLQPPLASLCLCAGTCIYTHFKINKGNKRKLQPGLFCFGKAVWSLCSSGWLQTVQLRLAPGFLCSLGWPQVCCVAQAGLGHFA